MCFDRKTRMTSMSWGVALLVVIVTGVFYAGCADEASAGSGDTMPPAESVEISEVAVGDEELFFTVINPNDESVSVAIDFSSADAEYFLNDQPLLPDSVNQRIIFTLEQSNSLKSRARLAILPPVAGDNYSMDLHTYDQVRNKNPDVVSISFAPDLAITGVSLPDDMTVVAGGFFSLIVEMANHGYMDAPSSAVLSYYKSTDEEIDTSDELIQSETIAPLFARELATHSNTHLPVPYETDSYYYGVCIAPHGFEDVVLHNNCSGTTTARLAGDRIVATPRLGIALVEKRVSAKVGSPVNIHAKITNSGIAATTAATGVQLRLMRSNGGAININSEQQAVLSVDEEIDIDADHTQSLTISAHTASGVYRYGVCVRYLLTAEQSEPISVCSSLVTVLVSAISLFPVALISEVEEIDFDGTLRSGLALNARVTNTGASASDANTILRVVRSTIQKERMEITDSEQARVVIGTVSGNNGSETHTFSLPKHSASGTYYYGICASYTLPAASEPTHACSDARVVSVYKTPDVRIAKIVDPDDRTRTEKNEYTVGVGEGLDIGVIVNNFGEIAPKNVNVELVRVDTTAVVYSSSTAVETRTAHEIPPHGGAIAQTLTIPTRYIHGTTYHYGVCVSYVMPHSGKRERTCSSAITVQVKPLFGFEWTGEAQGLARHYRYVNHYQEDKFRTTLTLHNLIFGKKVSSSRRTYTLACDIIYSSSVDYAYGGYQVTNCKEESNDMPSYVKDATEGTFVYRLLSDRSRLDGTQQIRVTQQNIINQHFAHFGGTIVLNGLSYGRL